MLKMESYSCASLSRRNVCSGVSGRAVRVHGHGVLITDFWSAGIDTKKRDPKRGRKKHSVCKGYHIAETQHVGSSRTCISTVKALIKRDLAALIPSPPNHGATEASFKTFLVTISRHEASDIHSLSSFGNRQRTRKSLWIYTRRRSAMTGSVRLLLEHKL